MDLNKLKEQLQTSIPEELYDILPGQVVLFVPKDGITDESRYLLGEHYAYTEVFGFDTKISVVATDNDSLINAYAGRSPQETGSSYKVVICSVESFVGILSECFGASKAFIAENIPREIGVEQPFYVTIDSTKRPVKDICSSCPYRNAGDDESPLEVLISRPEPGSKAEKTLIKKEEDKLYSLLRECYALDIDLDVDKIRKKFDKAVNSNIDYQLIIKGKFHKSGLRIICDFCDIYVAEGKEFKLDLTAVEKAIYLTFLLYGNKGIRVKETFWGFRETCMKIYGRLPDDERNEKEGGFRDDEFAIPEVYLSTLRGYLSTIRTKVSKVVLNPKTAIEFAIEGYKDQEYRIARSTPEIITQVKEYFGV